MLVLTRRCGESLYLYTENERIDVRVIEVRGRQVRIGVTASQKVKVLRDEIAKKTSYQCYT